jgi:hypothetical protein
MTTFGLHLFCGGRYCGCVLFNIFSISFSLLSFVLRRCNLRFLDRVRPDEHHRGMEYFGLTALLVSLVNPIGLAVPTYQIQKFGCPQEGYCGIPYGYGDMPTFDWVHKVLEDMHTGMAQVGMGVEVSVYVHWVLDEYHYKLPLPIGEKT